MLNRLRLLRRPMLLLMLLSASSAAGMEPADPAQVEQALRKCRYTWNDAELPLDDLLISGKSQRPAEITTDEAVEDVERLFTLFSHGYAGYGFFDDGSNWEQARQDILAELRTKTTWRVKDLPPLFARHLGFIRDCHLTIGTRRFADHLHWWYDTDHELRRDLEGYRINVNGTFCRLVDINCEDPARFIRPSLNAQGEMTYRIGCLEKEKPADLTVNYMGESGPEALTVSLARSDFRYFSFKRFDSDEIGGIPVLRVRSFSDHYWKELEEFVATADTVKDTPVVIVDVRGNHGGNERWPIDWLKGMTGVRAESIFVFSELRSRTALAGRVNGLKHVLERTPDSTFLREAVKINQERLGAIPEDGAVDIWIPTRYPDFTIIPNRTTIVIITNGLVASAGEGFVMRASRLENVVVVGENTRGALTFGNGGLHRLPRSRIAVWMPINFGLFPDLKFREEVGLEPDYWVPAADALNYAVAAIRNGTIETAIPLTPEMRHARFVPEDTRHIRRKLLIIAGFMLLGLILAAFVLRKQGRLVIPGSIWVSVGVIWVILGHTKGKVLMLESGAGLVGMGLMFMVVAGINRFRKNREQKPRVPATMES